MKRSSPQMGFTLIETLVVSSLIAMLVAVLIPSLSRARELARMTQCQNNIHALATAFHLYADAEHGRLPGNFYDTDADWLGGGNITPPHTGRKPEDGTLFRSYMERKKALYVCPSDIIDPAGGRFFSYTSPLVLSGARTEMLSESHYRKEPDPLDSRNYSDNDHRANMRNLRGAPLIIEEDVQYSLITNIDGGWGHLDSVTDRHLAGSGPGWGCIGFSDTHIELVQLSPGKGRNGPGVFFRADSLCIRVGHKWVSADTGVYGYVDHALNADSLGVLHQ